MGEFSITHILLLALIFLIFFGPSRLPSLGKSIGQAIRGFKQGLTEIEAESKPVVEPPPQQIPNQQSQQIQAGSSSDAKAHDSQNTKNKQNT
jgi:sec-independent protein translocase protein TatA